MQRLSHIQKKKMAQFSSELKIPRKQKYDKTFNAWYSGPIWRALRKYVFKRDNYLCVICLRSGNKLTPATCIDHIKPFRSGKDEEDIRRLFSNANNCQALCDSCHKSKSAYDSNRGE